MTPQVATLMQKNTSFQIDPPSGLNFRADTSLMLAVEGQKRGYDVWWHAPQSLTCLNGEIRATLQRLTLDNDALKAGDARGVTLGEVKECALNELHSVWLRQDPPFDMGYITSTHLLERSGTRVFNNPAGVRGAPEKISPLAFAHYMPPTLIATDADAIHRFTREQGTVVAKPLYGYGGRSVFKFAHDDGNLATFLEFWRESSNEPLMWQAFLPEVKTGDRRLILIDGTLHACFGRTPEQGSIRANMRVGGEPVAAEPTARQIEIAQAVGVMAKAQGLLIVGLDVIGDYLTEINVTSPTGLRAAEKLYGINLAANAWDAVEAAA